MGNSASSNSAGNDPRRRSSGGSRRHSAVLPQATSPEPSSSNLPHPSMRHKKKSIDLPDLAHLNLTGFSRQNSRNMSSPPIRSQPIPISGADGPNQRFRRPSSERSDTSLSGKLSGHEISTHRPLTLQRQYGDVAPRDSIQEEEQPIPDDHESDDAEYGTYGTIGAAMPQPPPPSRSASMQPLSSSASPGEYRKIVVHSSIPQPPRRMAAAMKPVTVRITWTGGGEEVDLAQVGDEDGVGRVAMSASADSSLFTLTVPLLPGVHHIRFLADGQWKVSDDLPKAVDEDGNLANYIGVHMDGSVVGGIIVPDSEAVISTPIAPSTFPHHYGSLSPPNNMNPGHSFWSGSSATDGDDHSNTAAISAETEAYHQTSQALGKRPAQWTDEIPLDLIEAASEEEIYLQATAASEERQNSQGTRKINGFIPHPPIPPAPGLPRHLERLILNTKTYPGHTSASTGPSGKESRKSSKRSKDRDTHSSDGLPVSSGNLKPTTKIMDDMVIADDSSVLPVPSHVVLHHLSTSAIKNGVLAVGETVRYREKYLTTVYYKPTEI